MVTLDDMKAYLRVDFSDDDALIEYLITSALHLCMDIVRTDDEDAFWALPYAQEAVFFTVGYMYEHREDADFHRLSLSLRALLSGSRKEGF